LGAPTQGAKLERVKVWLLDTGPLVAYLDARDRAHVGVGERLGVFAGRLITTSAVITEAMYFANFISGGPETLSNFALAVELSVYDCAQPPQLKEAAGLMRKYDDTPMDFADATLVLLADELGITEIATLDRRGFSTYRTKRGKSFGLVLDD
jgi:predicted nucleic acid-binding protein